MVFFTCDGCGEALKKNQVDKHKFKCRSATYSCIDCNAVFTSVNYKDHIKCISEDQKYGGKNFVQKENKGEVKQNKWVDQVERAIAKVKEPAVKGVLQQILGFGNIPRKQAKFVNFLMNSIRIRDRNLCVKAWDCIAAEASKMQEEENKQKEDEKKQKEEVKKEEKESQEDQTSSANATEQTTNGKHKEATNGTCSNSDFKWKKAIKRALKEEGGEMKVKKLRKSIIGEYLENRLGTEDSTAVRELFDSKLSTSGVVVDGKMARLS